MQRLISYLLLCLIYIGCSKNDSPPQQPPSSEKNLNGVVFKTSDNPGLQEDVAGTITGDSMKVKFPSNISLTALVPTIDFTGASITPANRTSQNFTSPITYKITAQDGSTKNFAFNSSYRTFSDSVVMIVTKWILVKDSSTNTGFSFPSCGYPIPGVYIGITGDYCDFNIDGNVYIYGNNHLASAPYQILPGKITINSCGILDASIQYLSATKLTLYWSLSNAGGQYTRTLYLRK
jgi:hypothetical protein